MSLFLLTFLSLYAGMHYYAFRKVNSAFPLSFPAAVTLVIWMLAMVLAPMLVRLFEREGLDALAVPLSLVGYTWMGFLFLFCVTILSIDLVRLLLWIAGRFLHRDVLCFVNDRSAFLVACVVSLGVSCYGFLEAKAIRLEKVVIPTAKLPPSIRSFRIVQISDVHLGLVVKEQRLANIIKVIESAHPDLLVSTGDLLDGQTDGMRFLSDALLKVRVRYGKFAVTGNHEYYAGIRNSLDFMQQAGFSVLQDELQDVGGIVTVAGVNDPAGTHFGAASTREKTLLEKAGHGRYVLLLKHRPVVDKECLGLFDLQLSGHVHKGQIFPFGLVTKVFYPAKIGQSQITGGGYLYVSRGTGTWGPPIRFLAPPEITVIELVNSSLKE